MRAVPAHDKPPAAAPGVPVRYRRQRRTTLMMRAVPGGVEVYIPHWLSPRSRQVRTFVQEHLPHVAAHAPPAPPQRTSPAEIRALVKAWAARVGVTPRRVQFQASRRSWGSCSARGTLTFGHNLCALPPHLAEYVVVHELAHLRELHHGPAFWALLDAWLPDWQVRAAAIAAHGNAYVNGGPLPQDAMPGGAPPPTPA